MRAALCLLLVACGDNAVAPDALVVDATDAAPDTPAPPAGCSWGELFDAANHTAPEHTNLAFAGAPLVLCGQIDPGHTAQMLVDSDAFGFSLPTERAIRVELAGDVNALGVELSITNRFGDPLATSRFIGAHAVTAATLPAGDYGVAVRAVGAEPASAIAYVATITVDTATCAPTGPSYTESAAANDVVEVRYTGDPTLRRVLIAGSSPEPAAAATHLTGTSDSADSPDDFRDRDAFAITTGAVDTMTVRLDWTGTADLDLLVFPAGVPDEIAGSTRVATSGPETATFAVAPSTTYWIWVGAYDTSASLPVTYAVALCPE